MSENRMSLEEVLDDVCVRFLLNIPEEELESFERLFFQLEEAHWFYRDFYCNEYPNIPKFGLKSFCMKLFDHVPFLKQYKRIFDAKYDEWKSYKLKVPVYGAILINKDFNKCILVKGWKNSSTWGFPKGKINKDDTGRHMNALCCF